MEHLEPHLKSVPKPGDVVSSEAAFSPQTFVPPITEIRWRQRYAQVHDVDGSLWNVHEARATKYGFDLLFGFVANTRITGKAAQRKPRLIATYELVAHWEAHRCEERVIFDLPANRTAIKKLRRKLGLNFYKDRRALWQRRIDDLKTLNMHQFAERYNVDCVVAEDWRYRLVGRVARPAGWWKDPAVLEVLQSSLSTKEIAEKLNLCRDYAATLRRRVLSTGTAPLPRCRRLPAHWQTQAALEVLRSNLTNRQKAAQLGITISNASLLSLAARELGLAA